MKNAKPASQYAAENETPPKTTRPIKLLNRAIPSDVAEKCVNTQNEPVTSGPTSKDAQSSPVTAAIHLLRPENRLLHRPRLKATIKGRQLTKKIPKLMPKRKELGRANLRPQMLKNRSSELDTRTARNIDAESTSPSGVMLNDVGLGSIYCRTFDVRPLRG
jgi:hypothetical protein